MASEKIVRVNMNTLTIRLEPVPTRYRFLGGRSLTSRIVWDEVEPGCNPLSEDNKLILAPGYLSGTGAPCSGRLSVGGKSPLTDGIKESNVGGTAATALAHLNIRCVIIEGKPVDNSLYVLLITPDGVRLEKDNSLKALSTYQTVAVLFNKYGTKNSIICIGPAGEALFRVATLAVTEHAGFPSRHAARGGLGAVMGSKGIKGIVISKDGSKVNIKDSETFSRLSKGFHKTLAKTRTTLREYGTSNLLSVVQELGGLPTRSFRQGKFEKADSINAVALKKLINERNGRTGVFCHAGCPIRCSNVFNNKQGEFVTASLEYETICMMGSNLGIDCLDSIARMDRICDEAGMDTIEIGAALGILMDAGVLSFGDADAACAILSRNSKAGWYEQVVDGAFEVGRSLQHDRVPTVRKQAIAAYDPRIIVGTGLTYATSAMGADHTAGNVLPGRTGYHREALDPLKADMWMLSHDLQVMTAVCDYLGFCFFVGPTLENVKLMSDLVKALDGEQITYLDLLKRAKSTIVYERGFNECAGINMDEDGIPDFFKTEPLPPMGSVFTQAEDIKKITTLLKKDENEKL